tara:strand:+ start:51 stop:335 length:285 start_codon:yes stop_codon:yes gene_type:complete
MKQNVVLNKSELALVINNLTMLKQVDGCFQGVGMTKLYEDLNNAYDRMNDPIYKRLDTIAKELLNNNEEEKDFGYDEAYEQAKELLIEDIKYQF